MISQADDLFKAQNKLPYINRPQREQNISDWPKTSAGGDTRLTDAFHKIKWFCIKRIQ